VVFRSPARFSQVALRGLVGMVCLGAGWVMLSGRTCQASCGDYVMLKGSHAKMAQADDALQAPVPRKIPCNTPACRGEVPELPVYPVPPSNSPTEKPLALFALSIDLQGGSPNCDWPTTSEHARPGFRSPLERPPSF
jgi:hypothetical protein